MNTNNHSFGIMAEENCVSLKTFRLMVVHSNGDGKTSQVLLYSSVDDCERAARRIEKWANGYSPWQVMRMDYDVGDLRQYTETMEWFLAKKDGRPLAARPNPQPRV